MTQRIGAYHIILCRWWQLLYRHLWWWQACLLTLCCSIIIMMVTVMVIIIVIIIIIIVVVIVLCNSYRSISVYFRFMEIPLLWSYVTCDEWYTVWHFLSNVQCSSDILCFENAAFIHFSWSHNSCRPNLQGFVFKFWYVLFPDIVITLFIMICLKYMRRTAGYTWTDYKTNTQITKGLKKHQFWTDYWNTRETGYNM